MKFPEGGEFSTRDLLVEESGGSRGPKNSRSEGWPEAKSRASAKLFAQLQLFGDRLVTAHVGALKVIQQAATLADVQAAARALARLPSETDDAMGQLQRLCLAHRIGV